MITPPTNNLKFSAEQNFQISQAQAVLDNLQFENVKATNINVGLAQEANRTIAS